MHGGTDCQTTIAAAVAAAVEMGVGVIEDTCLRSVADRGTHLPATLAEIHSFSTLGWGGATFNRMPIRIQDLPPAALSSQCPLLFLSSFVSKPLELLYALIVIVNSDAEDFLCTFLANNELV